MIARNPQKMMAVTFTDKDLGLLFADISDWLHSLSGDGQGNLNSFYYIDMGTPSYDYEYSDWTVVVFYKPNIE